MRLKPSKPVKTLIEDALTALPDKDLRRLLNAAEQCVKSAEKLSAKGHSPLSMLLRTEDDVKQLSHNHLPKGDVIDHENGYQFYIHSHRDLEHELAHAHIFFHATPTGKRRKKVPWRQQSPSHLVAISFANNGWPKGLFIPNLWVTDGFWLSAETIVQRILHMDLSKTPKQHLLVARFIQSLLQLCLPDIEALLMKRDILIQKASAKRPLDIVLKDETWEVICHLDFDFVAIVHRLETVSKVRKIGIPKKLTT